jgi:hypothetical protein
MKSLREYDETFGAHDESVTKAVAARKGIEFDPYHRGTCMRRAAKALFDAGIGFNLCFEGLGAALEEYMWKYPDKLMGYLEEIITDWPNRKEYAKEIEKILFSKEEPSVPPFDAFDVDEPRMIKYYASMLRQRYGKPLPKRGQ